MDNGSSSPGSYIRLVCKTVSACASEVQHLIEKCICYNMNREECMETLEKHAKIMPVITSTVSWCIYIFPFRRPCKLQAINNRELRLWISPFHILLVWKELEKENREFFETYKKGRGEEGSAQKSPLDAQGSASKSSDDDKQGRSQNPVKPQAEQANTRLSSC
ncbi:hypothetical protein HU200_004799 [Digitaria exilis]|uniref:Uncharacterized protein n=1 Tax=Digitaria exilis TaxID=1010633 RepID=A0A835KTB2_9POAL|nr:hypothetical protein HU200_004799 [Digitaria exilis]